MAGDLSDDFTLGCEKGAPVKRIRKVGVDERVPVRMSVGDRKLILQNTFADPELIAPLEKVVAVRGQIVAQYTLSEIDELLGFIAAESNHTKNPQLRRKLDRLYERFQNVLGSYADELSPEWLQKLAT